MMQEAQILCIDSLQQDVENLCGDFNLQPTIIPIVNISNKSGVELTQESIQIINNIYQNDAELYLFNLNS